MGVFANMLIGVPYFTVRQTVNIVWGYVYGMDTPQKNQVFYG